MPDTFQYLIISALSIALIVIMFFRKRKKQSVVTNQQAARKVFSESVCHESAYKLLPEVILLLNSQYQITYLNPAAESMLGCKLRSVMGKDYRNIINLRNIKTNRTLHEVINNELTSSMEVKAQEYLLHTPSNQNFPVQLKLIPLLRKSGKGSEFYSLLVLRNISEQKALESRLSMIETYDSLTGVLNRKSFENEVKQLIESTHKHDSVHVLSYFSIDQFQEINDSIGHSSSEALIKTIVKIMKENIKETIDSVARVGGSEFCIVFRERKVVSGVKAIESILKQVVDHSFMSRGRQYPVSLSAGFVVLSNESTSSARVLSEANRACNLASKRGGNRLFAYRSDDKEIQKLEGNFEWVLILKKAIQENRFVMYAQPIHLLEPNEYRKPFSHYELLIRLNDEEGKPIPPTEFISAAEYYSMMPALDRWVIQNVFKKLSTISKQEPMPVFAINLSGQSLNDAVFLDFVLSEVKSSGVNPKILCFEITEQVAVDDISSVNKFISRLKALGSSFSLDDFGTGVSSFGYLRSLDVDYLKIDGSFVKNIVTDNVSRGMVESITQIGHTMDLKIIAEYVENKETKEILNVMGVDYGQGYHISRPGPLDAVIRQHQVVKKAITNL